jgi:hypothetical protein
VTSEQDDPTGGDARRSEVEEGGGRFQIPKGRFQRADLSAEIGPPRTGFLDYIRLSRLLMLTTLIQTVPCPLESGICPLEFGLS